MGKKVGSPEAAIRPGLSRSGSRMTCAGRPETIAARYTESDHSGQEPAISQLLTGDDKTNFIKQCKQGKSAREGSSGHRTWRTSVCAHGGAHSLA
jgi:hypothetical protein